MSDMNPKEIIKKSRDKFLASIIESINKIDAQLRSIEKTQSENNALYKKLEQKIENSGTFRISDNEIMAKIFSGAKMHLDPRDIGLVPHLVLDGEWEHNITQAWLSVAKKGDVVVDIGANFGYFSVLAAQQTNRDCMVILFEANPSLIPYLHKTMAVNSFEECSVIENLAAGDSSGTVKLNILEDFIASSSILPAKEIDKYMHGKMEAKVASTVSVKSTTLDKYCEEKNIKTLNLIKMDIEGYEDKAYQGMRKIVNNSPDITLFIEFTKDAYSKPKELYEQMLKDFGYVYLINEKGDLITPSRTDYKTVIGDVDDWVMPVFSKNKNLASKR
jgi:FkbM family methyltransferase